VIGVYGFCFFIYRPSALLYPWYNSIMALGSKMKNPAIDTYNTGKNSKTALRETSPLQ